MNNESSIVAIVVVGIGMNQDTTIIILSQLKKIFKMGKIKNTIIDQMNIEKELNNRIIADVMREARHYGLETEAQAKINQTI